ncbi:hypothetical protein P8452_46439 [Trifolium repens]|nr:hypothetical protein P8452_20740 [Trifolium repens]WJX59633.1 hypothetical protein P8452_44936 [Trifolium repens]WJX61337.1 hypothetical protein P8452_46439 [Trifolium repens]
MMDNKLRFTLSLRNRRFTSRATKSSSREEEATTSSSMAPDCGCCKGLCMHVIVIAIPITAKHGVEFCLDFAQLYFNPGNLRIDPTLYPLNVGFYHSIYSFKLSF